MQVARAQSEVRGETAHVYTDTRYAAGTWDHERRVVIKAEVVRLGDREPRDNPRFVVTNLRQTPRFIYEKVYCARGDIENRIKELLDGLQIDRTSCCLFSANQLRVFLTAAAYVLMQELRLRAARTACARSQVTWLRDRLLKLGGPRRPLGPPRGSASAALDAAPRGVAAHRTRAGRARRIAHPLRRAHLLPGRHGPLRRRGCRCPTLASVMPPRSAAQTPAPLAGGDVRDPFLRRITPFGGRIWTFVNNAGKLTSVPHFQDHASDNWEPEGAGSDGVVNRSWSGRRSNMLSWSTCSIW